jgi:Rieske Fe-S protein
MTAQPSRRTVLAASAAGAGALAVAACSPSSGSGHQATVSAPAGGETLTALSAVPVGGCRGVDLPGNDGPAIVSRPSASTVACFSAICTHQGCTVQPAGKQLQCPCHGSVFDAFTGAVINGPAPSPLPRIAVQVQGGNVVTATG